MSVHDFNPDICLEVLHGIIEEIPSGVSGRDLKKICPKIKFSQELLNYINDTIITSSRKAIDWLWTTYNVPEKLKRLGEMEKSSTDAWRPETGKVNINSIVAKNLLQRKKELIEQIEALREESAMIIPYLKTCSDQTKDQLVEMDVIEKKYSTI